MAKVRAVPAQYPGNKDAQQDARTALEEFKKRLFNQAKSEGSRKKYELLKKLFPDDTELVEKANTPSPHWIKDRRERGGKD